MRILGIAAVILVLLAAAVWLKLRGPDIPYATLESRHSGAASRFADV